MKQPQKRRLTDLVMKTPLVLWFFLGFLIVYLLFFIRPVFFSGPVMQFFQYLPAEKTLGIDLQQMLSYSRELFINGRSPYIGQNLYPPLASVLFAPLLLVPFSFAYGLITLLSILAFVVMTFLMPFWRDRKAGTASLLALFLFTGLVSYGMQFELERGQFNLIAIFLCYLAIWIFHYRPKYRLLAYGLFTLSVQLKVYPFIFILLLVRDWRDWKNNIRRVLTLAGVNLAALFVLGPRIFVDFTHAITSQTLDPAVWTGNHSITSFVAVFAAAERTAGFEVSSGVLFLIRLALFLVVVLLLFYLVLQAYRQKRTDLDPFLLLACTLGALLFPPVSHDYTLPLLVPPVALLLSSENFWERKTTPRQQILLIELVFIFSAAYASTLISYTNKPPLLNNNFPMLLILLMICAIFSAPFKAPVPLEISAPMNATGEKLDVRA